MSVDKEKILGLVSRIRQLGGGGQLKNCFEPGGSIPTLEEYYTKQADSVRNAALNNSRTRILPRSIPDGFVDLQGEENILRGLAAEHAAAIMPQYDSFVSPISYRFDDERTRLGRYLNTLGNMEQYRSASYDNLPFTPVDEYLRLAAEGRMDNIDNAYASQRYTEDADSVAVRRIRGDVIPKFAPNCIATATDSYGPGHYVQSNAVFLADPYKYGFEKIPVGSAKPGDLVQVLRDDGTPFHAMIFNGLDDNGLATFNYSNGEEGESAYHKNWHWYDTPFVDGAFNAFRFVGTDADREAWQKEYESQFAGGGKIHIAPSKRGTFTAAAKKHGKSVQGFASQVLAHKENYSPAMVKKANFARNAAKWHAAGGLIQRFGAEKILQALQKMK